MSLVGAEETSNESTFETFDDMETIAEEAESADDGDWSKPEPEKEKVSEDLKVIKDSQADSEGKVIKEDKKQEKEDDEEEAKLDETKQRGDQDRC